MGEELKPGEEESKWRAPKGETELREYPEEETTEIKSGEVSELDLDSLSVGDKIIVDTGDDPEQLSRYEITIVSKPKKSDNPFKIEYSHYWLGNPAKVDNVTAKFPGGFRKSAPQHGWAGVSQHFIRVGDKDCLYFETPKDAVTGDKIGKSTRTMPIRRIEII